MKVLNIRNTALLLFAFLFVFAGCRRKSTDLFDEITIDSDKKPLSFVFGHSEIAASGDFAQPILKRINQGKISGIPSGSVNLLTLHPSVSDPLYNTTAEQFKFLHDSNGDDTFSMYPSFWTNGTNYGVDTTAFYEEISAELSRSPDAGIGIKLILENGILSIYTKVKYFRDVNYDRLIAVYLYEKSSNHPQETSQGTVNQTFLNKLNVSVTSGYGGRLNGSASADSEGEYLYQANMSGISTSNLGVLAVLFKAQDGKPIGVINSTTN